MSIRSIPLSWEVGHHAQQDEQPGKFVPAAVPGAVQLDWAAAEGWGPWWHGDNWKQYRWMEDCFWTYRARIADAAGAGQRVFLVLQGVDYQFDVRLNGEMIACQEGMFTAVRLELTGKAKAGDEIQVRIHPAPKSCKTPENRDQANRSCKPAVSYEWDFHPRLIPLGIWQDACIQITPQSYIKDCEVRYALSEDLSSAQVSISIDIDGPNADATYRMIAPDGKVALEGECKSPGRQTITRELKQPTLWWPHDHGTPALYTFEVRQGDQVVTKKVGFRRARLVMHEGAWRHPENFPKGPSNPPITLEINNRRIFAKGSNFVSPDVFPGTLNAERYRQQLQIARDSNMNILRMWGGAPAQKEAFYQIADELGLMIWQEFPLACNNYADDPHYLQILDQESRSLITRLRQHACVVLFCGGNELFNSWSGMTEQSHALRLLDRNCYDLASDRPFLKTSPIMGMAHGHYCFRDMKPGIESWSLFQRSAATAYTEFGMGGSSPVEVLRRCKAPEKLALMTKTAIGRKDLGEGLHIQPGTIEHYFGEQTSLEEWVKLTHWLQGEGYRGLFEEARRQKPVAAMAINWCFNEPWPNLANLSLISWPTEPKGSMKQVGQALRPVIASARIKQFQWKEGELLDAELWILSDKYEQILAGQLRATLCCNGKEIPLLTWDFAEMASNTNQQGPRIQYRLPRFDADRFELRLSIIGRPEADSSYLLSYKATPPKA